MHPELPSPPRPPRRVSARLRPPAGPVPRRRAAPVGVGALLALVFLGGSQAVGAVVPVSPPSPQQAPALTATGDGAPLDLAPPPPVSATTQGTSPAPVGTPAAGSTASPVPATGVGSVGIPAVVLAAYRRAETSVAATTPGCHLSWALLAAIGQVESGQADNGDVSADGTTLRPILGPLLDGSSGTAAIRDTAGNWARAEGPMQFLPSTWATWGADGNGDGIADPNNVFDAALAAGHYLCAGSGDLNRSGDLRSAILSYNHSDSYLTTVLAWMSYYQHSVVTGVAPVTQSATPAVPSATTAAPTTAPATTAGPATPSATPSRTTPPPPSASASTARPSAPPTADPSASTGGSPSPTATPTPSASPSSPAGCPSTSAPTGGTPTPTPSASAPTTPPATASPSPTSTLPATTCPSPTPSPTTSHSTATPTTSTTAGAPA